jgi:hypothetical protein
MWLHWLWNTGLPFAPRTVILRGFAVYVGLILSPFKVGTGAGECRAAKQRRNAIGHVPHYAVEA